MTVVGASEAGAFEVGAFEVGAFEAGAFEAEWLGQERNLEAALAEVRHAHDHQPFFRRHLEAAGLGLDDVADVDGFRRIPPTVKADYRRNFPRGVVATPTPLDDRLVIHSQSSGTGGDRLITVAYSYDLARRMRLALRANPPFHKTLRSLMSANVCRYAPPNCSEVECAAPLATMQDRMLPTGALVLPVAHDLLATPPHLLDQTLAEIDTYGPRWFDADATHLAFLLRQYRQRDRTPPPLACIMLSYTMATRVARSQVRRHYPAIPVVEVVMMTELGWVATECPAGALHLNTGALFAELLRAGAPVARGQLGELVATGLGDRLSPHIRYRTGDVYRLLGPCDCGSGPQEGPAVRFEGRWRHMMVREGEIVLTPRDVDDLVGAPEWMDLYRLVQIDDATFRFRYVRSRRDPGEAELRDRLAAALDAGSRPVRLDFEAVDHIATDRTGKFVSCISQTPEAGERVGAR